jgi:hypothetical protein
LGHQSLLDLAPLCVTGHVLSFSTLLFSLGSGGRVMVHGMAAVEHAGHRPQ